MKALSVKQPRAWAIIHAGKDIENRRKLTRLRQPIAIHTSRKADLDWKESYPARALKPPPQDEWENGVIIGFVGGWDGLSSFVGALKQVSSLTNGSR